MLRNYIAKSARAFRPVPAVTFYRAAAQPSLRSNQLRFYSEEKKANEESPKEATEEGAEKTQAETETEKSPAEQELNECLTKLEEKDKLAAQLKDKYLRSVADFQNLQVRTAKEVQDAKDYALRKFAKDLLESVDNFDRALSVVDEDKKKDPATHKELIDLYEGIKMTQAVFEKTLEKHGITKINPIDEPFDPNFHEATFQAPQPGKKPGHVFYVQQTGFMYNGKVLRAAKVGVVPQE